MFPAIFATHQFIEGVLWLNHDGVLPDTYQSVAVHAYALIAYVLWPMLVPFAAYLLEGDRRRRLIILGCQVIGLWAGLALLVSFVREPVSVSADCCSLTYHVNAPEMLIAPYLVAVCIPFLVASCRGLVFFGLAVAGSCIAAAILATASAFPSVWCSFAACLSAGLYLYFRATARATSHPLATSSPGAIVR
jgi:hypothetical protein